jgi:hypothetical protein
MQSIRSSLRRVPRLSRLTTAVAVAALALGATASVASAKQEVMIVSQGTPPATYPSYVHYFTTIQAAVNAATHPRDFVLIEPGTYEEEVKVKPVNKGIFIRGMNRNTVLVDGEHIHTPGGANGIEVQKTDDVWIENLTVANFERESLDGGGGNEIWWNGSSGEEKIGAHGWFGNYLTAYDTGLDGGYGIFTSHETKGEWNNIYASGFNDSGIYLGACPECEAVINHATMEYNALGYSGSNSGGQLIIENSTFDHNTTGIAPNTENPGDGPPPQDGACKEAEAGVKRKGPLHGETTKHQGPWTGKLPVFKTTHINHCTIIEGNKIDDNSDLDLPANHSAAAAPWGAGVELPGNYGDEVLDNEIEGNPSDGVLAFEYPNPFEPNEKDEFPPGTIFAQNGGNRVEGNVFADNGYLGNEPQYAEQKQYFGDVAFEGGVWGTKQSLNDCLSDNTMPDGSYPTNIEGTWGCQNETTPNPGGGFPFAYFLLALQEESTHRPYLETVPAPPAQETMPNPCENVPANPLCE